jgi:hypothetical protein
MNKEIETLIELLKKEIQSKLGKTISYAADCEVLSEQIQNTTKRTVSISTLKRFFGIIKSPFSPSKYTLDTLAVYVDFNNWQEFVNHFENEKQLISRGEIWDSIKKENDIITQTSLKSLKDKIGKRLENFPLRKFADKKFDEFLCSSKIATALIAPDGYGKSTTVTQLAEKYFTGIDSKYPNDIVCLVDGSILYNLLTYSPEVGRLYNLIEYDPVKGFNVVFRKNPDLVKGRFVVIVDGIDDIYSDNEKTDHFIDNLLNIISSYENIGWFKLLITCSPNKWRMVSYRMQKKQILKSFWFDVTFQGTDDDIINIPLLKRKEIRTILGKNNFHETLDDLCFNHPNILDIISNPYMLHLFLSTYKPNDTIRDIDLLNQFISKAILFPPYHEEKFLVIRTFITLCGYGKKGTEVRKEDLNLSPSTIAAYNELIVSGILTEYSINDSSLSLNIFVKFSQNILFSYYLAKMLIKENELSTDLLINILRGYSNSTHLSCDIMKYIIKILFKDEQVEILKNIFSIIEKEKGTNNLPIFNSTCFALARVIGVELRKNQKLREILIPWYAQSEPARTLYFQSFFDFDCLVLHSGHDLDSYLQYNQSNDAKQYVCFMKFMEYFLCGNKELCKAEFEKSITLEFPIAKDSLITSFYFVPQIIYQSVYEKKLDRDILKVVRSMSDLLIRNGIQNRTDLPKFEFAIIFALNYGELNMEIIDLARFVYENYDLTNLNSSCLYQLFLSVYSRALLETGKTKKAIELFSQVNFKGINIPDHMKYYIRIRHMLIRAEFLILDGELKKARKILKKIKDNSQMLKFNYFYNSAICIENSIATIPDCV